MQKQSAFLAEPCCRPDLLVRTSGGRAGPGDAPPGVGACSCPTWPSTHHRAGLLHNLRELEDVCEPRGHPLPWQSAGVSGGLS
jgi:hypothetical protein